MKAHQVGQAADSPAHLWRILFCGAPPPTQACYMGRLITVFLLHLFLANFGKFIEPCLNRGFLYFSKPFRHFLFWFYYFHSWSFYVCFISFFSSFFSFLSLSFFISKFRTFFEFMHSSRNCQTCLELADLWFDKHSLKLLTIIFSSWSFFNSWFILKFGNIFYSRKIFWNWEIFFNFVIFRKLGRIVKKSSREGKICRRHLRGLSKLMLMWVFWLITILELRHLFVVIGMGSTWAALS